MSYWTETSEESMDGTSGWDTEVLGPFANQRAALDAAGVTDGDVEYHNGKPQHRFLVTVFEAATRREALQLRSLDNEETTEGGVS